MTLSHPIRIGTRGSRLALIQAEQVKRQLLDAHPYLQDNDIILQKVTTSGDRCQERSLADIGGKALFTKELEDALLEGNIDMAVHSMKDMEATLPAGLAIGCVLEREDARDVLVCTKASSLRLLPEGIVFGTSSPRRAASLLHQRPDSKIVPLRGNVETRLDKLTDGVADATLLALAGLKRLNIQSPLFHPLSIEDMLPSAAQGVIAVECDENNADILALLAPLNHCLTFQAVTAERAVLKALGGTCHTPIGCHATIEKETVFLQARLFSPDGTRLFSAHEKGSAEDAYRIGQEVGGKLLRDAGRAFVNGFTS